MNFFENFVEMDLNPILTFSSNAKLLYSNTEAQFLLNKINQKEIFDFALKYAPKTFGTLTSYINLKIQNYTFYAITTMYENEDEIHVKLYKSLIAKQESNLNTQRYNHANIFTLVDLVISTNKLKYSINLVKNYDPSIPEFKIDEVLFIKVLNELFEVFIKDDKNITCSILLKTGEYVKIEDKKYSLVSIELLTNQNNIDFSKNFINNDSSFLIVYHKNKICIDLPLIL